jgi:hypothetical protein
MLLKIKSHPVSISFVREVNASAWKISGDDVGLKSEIVKTGAIAVNTEEIEPEKACQFCISGLERSSTYQSSTLSVVGTIGPWPLLLLLQVSSLPTGWFKLSICDQPL